MLDILAREIRDRRVILFVGAGLFHVHPRDEA